MFGYFRNHIRTHFNDNKNTESHKKEYVGYILNKKDLISFFRKHKSNCVNEINSYTLHH